MGYARRHVFCQHLRTALPVQDSAFGVMAVPRIPRSIGLRDIRHAYERDCPDRRRARLPRRLHRPARGAEKRHLALGSLPWRRKCARRRGGEPHAASREPSSRRRRHRAYRSCGAVVRDHLVPGAKARTRARTLGDMGPRRIGYRIQHRPDDCGSIWVSSSLLLACGRLPCGVCAVLHRVPNAGGCDRRYGHRGHVLRIAQVLQESPHLDSRRRVLPVLDDDNRHHEHVLQHVP